jgi:hypothetical protein
MLIRAHICSCTLSTLKTKAQFEPLALFWKVSAAAAQHVVCLRKHLELKGSDSDVDSKLGALLLQRASNHSEEQRYGPKKEEETVEPDGAGFLQILLQLPNLSTSTLSEDSATPSNPLSRALQQAAMCAQGR